MKIQKEKEARLNDIKKKIEEVFEKVNKTVEEKKRVETEKENKD